MSTTQTSAPFAERFLVVLGTLLRSHAGRSDPLDKEEVALGRSDDATVIVSPPAFRDLVLAPQLLRSLLPIHLDRHLPDDFLARLPRGALTRFTNGLSGQALTDRRKLLAQPSEERNGPTTAGGGASCSRGRVRVARFCAHRSAMHHANGQRPFRAVGVSRGSPRTAGVRGASCPGPAARFRADARSGMHRANGQRPPHSAVQPRQPGDG